MNDYKNELVGLVETHGTKKVQKMLMGYVWKGEYWMGQGFYNYRPVGLMIWGAVPGMMLRQMKIGNLGQVIASWDPVPALWFGTAQSYEQLKELIKEDKALNSWVEFDTLSLGCYSQIDIRDKDGKPCGPNSGISMCTWGYAAIG